MLTCSGAGTRCLQVPWQLAKAASSDRMTTGPRTDTDGFPSPLSLGSILRPAPAAGLGSPQSTEPPPLRSARCSFHSSLAGRITTSPRPANATDAQTAGEEETTPAGDGKMSGGQRRLPVSILRVSAERTTGSTEIVSERDELLRLSEMGEEVERTKDRL